MSKIKLLTFSVIALLLLNIGILVFLFTSGIKGRKQEPREIVIQDLHFDSNQITAYDKLIIQHKEKIKSINDSIRIYKNELYNQLINKQNKVITDSLFAKITGLELEIEHTHYNHFLDIKKLCKTSQLEDYNELTAKLSEMFQSKQKKHDR